MKAGSKSMGSASARPRPAAAPAATTPTWGTRRKSPQTSTGGLGESAVGGPSINILPRTGGNAFRGSMFVANVSEWMVGDNLSQDTHRPRPAAAGRHREAVGLQPGVGRTDREEPVCGSSRTSAIRAPIDRSPACMPTRTPAIPTKRTYEADLSRPARGAGNWRTMSLRLTNQLTPRNRVGVFWDEQIPCHGGSWDAGIEACREPKDELRAWRVAGLVLSVFHGDRWRRKRPPIQAPTICASSRPPGRRRSRATSCSRRVSARISITGAAMEIPGNPTRDIVRVVEQCTRGCAANGGIAGLTYRSQNWANNVQKATNWKASASYVTARHSLKVGYQGAFHYTDGNPCHQHAQPAVPRRQRGAQPAHAEHVRRLHDEEPGSDRPRCTSRSSGPPAG